MIKRWALGLVVIASLLSACGSSSDGEAISVVVSTSVLGDLVQAVAGDDATVTVLVPIGADPHDYQPSSRQVSVLAGADLVVVNGLGLEEGLLDVVASSVDPGRVLELGPQLDPAPFLGGAGEGLDPHVWLDPLRMEDAAAIVAGRLAEISPGEAWAGRAEAYAARLRSADAEVAALVNQIPDDARKLVTNHDSLGYFAARYGFEILGTVIPGGSTLADPSSGELAALVRTIREANVRAIFAETTEPRTLAEAVAAELGSDVDVVELFAGSLGEPGSGAEDLPGLLVTNAERIVEALT